MKNICYLESADEVIAVLDPVRAKEDSRPFMNPVTHRLVLESGTGPRIVQVDGGLSLFQIAETVTLRDVVVAAFKAVAYQAKANGQQRMILRAWSGCENYEAFTTDKLVKGEYKP